MPRRRRSSSSAPPQADAELLLPRPPGLIRQFWARHPRAADVIVALLCLTMSSGTLAASVRYGTPTSTGVTTDAPTVAATAWIAVLAVATCAALLVRRRIPLLPLALATTGQLLFVFVPVSSLSPALAVAVYSLAVYRSNRACWIGYGVSVGAVAVVAAVAATTGAVAVNLATNAGLDGAVTALVGALIGVNVGNRKRYLAAVIDRSRQLLVERDQQAQLAAAAERARIARELHDIVAHNLTVMVALAEGATATADPARARAATGQIAETGRGALTQMRTMLGVLRDGHDDAPRAPLAPLGDDAIADTVAAARAAGFPVTLSTSGEAELPAPVRLALTRTVQEGLTNAMRHAPRATGIDVAIAYEPDGVHIAIRNDGAPGTSREGGYGIRGLRERVAHVGGTLEVGPRGAGEWALHARLPLEPRPEDGEAA
ncbi:sensor histidine kinase [Microbacterium sp.]|uniref:sensor histidine kinase n=1 Tax=Microbacterium sp. TaxID=51671 RepID=UPI0039E603CE